MPLLSSPLPTLRFDENSSSDITLEELSRQHRRMSSEYGWFDIEPLLSSRPGPCISGIWDDDEPEEKVIEGSSTAISQGALPRALERVFCWLEEVEAGHDRPSGVARTVIDSGALLALQAPNTQATRGDDKVVVSKAVTKADFCLASRDQPSTAIGIYAYRVVRRSKWLLWSDYFAEFLVVIGTETELLRAWRTYSDFSRLAGTAGALGALTSLAFWNRLDHVLGFNRKTDASSLITEVRLLGRFLTTVLEELVYSDVGILAEFLREPTTYVVVGVENFAASATMAEATGKCSAMHGEISASSRKAPRRAAGQSGNLHKSSSSGGGGFEAIIRHPMTWQMTGSSLKPAPRIWVGL